MNTLVKLVSLLVFITSLPAVGVLHPTLVNPRIVSCQPGGMGGGDCSYKVNYQADGVLLVDIVPAVPPKPAYGLWLQAVSIHCDYGSGPRGIPFSNCEFVDASNFGHAPIVYPPTCELKNYQSWELTEESHCGLRVATWSHSGADVGGECVVFVQTGGWGKAYAHTIYGLMDPVGLANSGSAYCQKALPPDVVCDVILPPTLDHGVINSNAHSVVDIDGTVDCGTKPVITILGGSKLQLAPGVTTEITTQQAGADRVRLTSTLDAINAEPGDHSASVVVVASPY